MREVKIFDGKGKLKKIIPKKKVIAKTYKLFKENPYLPKAKLKMKDYFCAACRIKFKSNSTRGASYCKKCRPAAYRRSKKRKQKEP